MVLKDGSHKQQHAHKNENINNGRRSFLKMLGLSIGASFLLPLGIKHSNNNHLSGTKAKFFKTTNKLAG